jgi:hypothetical protein
VLTARRGLGSRPQVLVAATLRSEVQEEEVPLAACQAQLAQSRAFLNTLATWGQWLILLLGYLSLLAQGLLAHSPTGSRPEATITQLRTRGR